MSIRKIGKSGFYDISGEKVVEIASNIEVYLFDAGDFSKEVRIGEHTCVNVSGFLEKKENYTVKYIHKGDHSETHINYLLLAHQDKIKARIHSKISAFNATSKVRIVSFIANKGEVDLDGIIELAPNYARMSGYLLEENIFLGETGKVRGIPTLLVKSDDVEASHACKIEKISDEKLFYMRSRGIEKENALHTFVSAYIVSIFQILESYDKVQYEHYMQYALKRLQADKGENFLENGKK